MGKLGVKITATVKKESTLKFCHLFKIPTVPASTDVPNSWMDLLDEYSLRKLLS